MAPFSVKCLPLCACALWLLRWSRFHLSLSDLSWISLNFLRPYTLEVPLPGEWSLLSLSCHVSARLVNESLIVSVILYLGPADKSPLFAPPPP